jgi:hypothetical protein
VINLYTDVVDQRVALDLASRAALEAEERA